MEAQHKFLAILFAISFIELVNSQVIFEDDEPKQQTPRAQFDIVVVTLPQQNHQSGGFQRPAQKQNFQQPSQQQNFQRPSQQQNFQRPNNFGFGSNSNNNGFQNPGSSFSSSSASAGGFQNTNFQNPQGSFQQNRPNFQNQNQGFQNSNEFQVEFRSPDCRTYRNTGGFCKPLSACGRIARAIQNRSPFVAARILQNSICGFSGIIPNVCCPMGRFQQTPPQIPPSPNPTPVKPPPFQNNNNNNFGFGNSNNDNNLELNEKNENSKNPGGFGGSKPVDNESNNNGGGLVIIPATPPMPQQPPPPPPTRVTTTTTTTPFPIEMVTDSPKKPQQSNSGGLIIGDGPIALLPPQKGGDSSSNDIGFSAEGLPEDCGFSNASHDEWFSGSKLMVKFKLRISDTRIVGGKIAEKGAWPWIAALGYKDDAGNVNYLCGGALISSSYVITASHCLHGRNDLSSVRLGDHDIYSTADGVTPLEVEVDKKIVHPNYDPATFKNDIALLHLKTPVPFTRQIHPICLPSTPQLRNQRFENTSPFVAGWGAIQFNGPASSVLREVQIPTVPDSECQQKYSSFKTAAIDDTNICAGLQRGGQDACQGDSGGPLQQPVDSNRYVLIGVVSFGFKCAEPDFPGVYSRVTAHLDWIENTIKQG